jgi:GNAT superfamily N-acetyltransferase
VDLDERRRLADENVIAAFSLAQARLGDPRGGSARFGAVQVVAVGVEVAFYNPVLALDPATTPADVRAAIAWVESKRLPVSVQVRNDLDDQVRSAIEELGLVADEWPTPVMALEPIPADPPGSAVAPPADVAIRTGGVELLDDWHAAIESGTTFRRIFGATLGRDPRVRLAVAYLDNVPVSAAAAIASGSTLGVYAVGTLERARRRGIGRAVTWAAIEAGRTAWGSTIAILQSSEMGLPVYRSMGFEVISHYTEYDRPKTT